MYSSMDAYGPAMAGAVIPRNFVVRSNVGWSRLVELTLTRH